MTYIIPFCDDLEAYYEAQERDMRMCYSKDSTAERVSPSSTWV